MIIPAVLLQRYQEFLPYVELVGNKVKETLLNYCERHDGYAFLSRVKKVESLAEKIETGRYKKWSDLDDLYACTVIVPTLAHENDVIEFLKTVFHKVDIKKRGQTKKSPETYRFDSTRFYGRLRRRGDEDPQQSSIVYDITFEVQVKTAFEHAWAVATHNLTYKSNDVSWQRLRLSSQIKANVEQLDHLILSFEQIASTIQESRWPDIKRKKKIIEFVQSLVRDNLVPEEVLPKDLSRFAENILHLLEVFVPYDQIDSTLSQGLEVVRDTLENQKYLVSLSLFQYFLLVLVENGIIQLNRLIHDTEDSPYSLHVTDELRTISRQFDCENIQQLVFDYWS